MSIDNLTVLYVEDETRSRKVMQMIASDAGIANLIMFEHSEGFLDRAEALNPRPDLVLLDIHVPPHDGFAMLKMLNASQHFEGIPIVAMTASVMNEEIEQLRSAGFDGCLAKPVDLDTFSDSIQQILGGETIWRIIG